MNPTKELLTWACDRWMDETNKFRKAIGDATNALYCFDWEDFNGRICICSESATEPVKHTERCDGFRLALKILGEAA